MDKSLITGNTKIRTACIGGALALILISILFQNNFEPGRWMTYRDFDYPEERNFITYLSPGIADVSTGTSYDFEHPHYALLLIILFGFFPLMLFLRAFRSLDAKLKIPRFITQWLSFVTARMGIFRVAGVCPVKRYSIGVFPFMNCQSCELATGACPLGTFQMSLVNKQLPLLVIGQTVLVGAVSGRAVCGWLCPYGFLSEIFDRLPGKRLKVPRIFDYTKYLFFGVFIISSIAYLFRDQTDALLYCSFLCPTGFYYGILEYALTTGLSDLVSQFPFVHWLFIYHILFAGMILVGSMKLGGRFFCKYACPLGTAYGFFAKIAIFRMRLNNNKCTNSKACIKVCPMKIDIRDTRLQSRSSCITCGRCRSVCPTQKIEYTFDISPLPSRQRETKKNRRNIA